MNQARIPSLIRLYVPDDLLAGRAITLTPSQSHYLLQVMRCRYGDPVALFNGKDGEWLGIVQQNGKKQAMVTLERQYRAQSSEEHIWLVFAPIKGKNEWMVEKAVELGVAELHAVFTRHAVVKSLNQEKLNAHAIEAAEQCERLSVPCLHQHKDLPALLAAWPKERLLLYGDESGQGAPLPNMLPNLPKAPLGVLIGPEGGFAKEEHSMLQHYANARGFGLGPRILRADTAMVAALACIQAWHGDWQTAPRFEAPE